MPSRREAILADALLALEAIGGGSYLTAPRTRSREFTPVEDLPGTAFPALYLTGAGEEKQDLNTEQTVAKLQLEIRGFVRRQAGPATGGTPLSRSLNDLLADVERAILADRTRGGNASDTKIGAVDADEISLDEIAGFLARFTVEYSYPSGDP